MRHASIAIVVALAGLASCVLPAATLDDTTGSSGGAGTAGGGGKGGASGAGGTGNRDAATEGSGGAAGLDAGNSDAGSTGGGVGVDANEGGGTGGGRDGGADVTADSSDGTATDIGSDAVADADADADHVTVVDSASDALADAGDATVIDSAPDALADGDAEDAAVADSAPDAVADALDAEVTDSTSDAVADIGDATVADSAPDTVADASDGAADGGAPSRWPDSPTAFCTNGTAAVACNTVTPGQDGTYTLNTPSYSTVGGVVSDTVTQLAWQDIASSGMNYAAASTFCATQTTGGRSWRLPTFLELLSTTDYGSHDPATQVGQLPGLSYLWTSDAAFDTTNAWAFLSSNGSLQTLAKTQTFVRVRCVSGVPFVGGFVVQPDTTILDQRTKLFWGPDAGTMTWANAISYCENASMGGFSDFRLPSLKELATLIVPGASPTYDPVFTDIPAAAYYASSTPNAAMPSDYWVLRLDTGNFNPLWTISSQTSRVRCVR